MDDHDDRLTPEQWELVKPLFEDGKLNKERAVEEIKRMYNEVADDLTEAEQRQLLELLAPIQRRIAERN